MLLRLKDLRLGEKNVALNGRISWGGLVGGVSGCKRSKNGRISGENHFGWVRLCSIKFGGFVVFYIPAENERMATGKNKQLKMYLLSKMGIFT